MKRSGSCTGEELLKRMSGEGTLLARLNSFAVSPNRPNACWTYQPSEMYLNSKSTRTVSDRIKNYSILGIRFQRFQLQLSRSDGSIGKTQNNPSSTSSSTISGTVTFKLGVRSISRFIAKTAPSFLAQLLRAMPLLTS